MVAGGIVSVLAAVDGGHVVANGSSSVVVAVDGMWSLVDHRVLLLPRASIGGGRGDASPPTFQGEGTA